MKTSSVFFRNTLAIAVLILSISAVNAQTPPAKPCYDFYGSGRTSFATFQRQNGGGITWRLQNNGGEGSETLLFGLAASDFVTPGYFDNDNKADIGVWRVGTTANPQGNYYIRPSTSPSTFFYGVPWGRNDGTTTSTTNDTAGFEGDYDGDGRTDPTIVRNINGAFHWFYLRSSNNTLGSMQFGSAATDVRLGGADYTGDGKDDIAVYRVGAGTDTFFIGDTSTGAIVQAVPWGEFNSDFVVIGDFVGDRKADFAVYRAFGSAPDRVWYILENGGAGQISYRQWGLSGDVAVCGDYTGDGKSDVAVYRPSNRTYYWLSLSGESNGRQFGAAGNTPIGALRVY